jgi:hypothetical protein
MLTNTTQSAQRLQNEMISMKSFNRLNRSFLATAACTAFTLLHTSILTAADGLPVKVETTCHFPPDGKGRSERVFEKMQSNTNKPTKLRL